MGSVGDSYDNALAETVIGLFKAELIHRRSWRSREAVERETLDWVDWYNHRRLLGSIGNIPRQKRRRRTTPATRVAPWRRDSDEMASGEAGAIHVRMGTPTARRYS